MLLAKTFLSISDVNGIGLFADEFLVEGRIVWEYSPLVDLTYSIEDWLKLEKNLSPESFSMLKRYTYKEKNKYIVCTDNAQFMNHCHKSFNLRNSSDLKIMYTTKDIYKGEELLCNYFEYSDPDDYHIQTLSSLLEEQLNLI